MMQNKNNFVENKKTESFPENMIVFIHIPKNAGSSLRVALEKKLKVAYDYGLSNEKTSSFIKETFYRQNFQEFLKVIKREQYQCLVGHFEAKKYACFFNRSTKIITFFREPIQRCISGYLHMCRHYGYNQEIEVFASKKHVQQSQAIKGLDLDNIFFGIQEDYENSIKLLSKQINIDLDIIKANINPNKRKKTQILYKCDSSLLKLFEINSLDDIKIYQRAKEIYARRLQKTGLNNQADRLVVLERKETSSNKNEIRIGLNSFQSHLNLGKFLQDKGQFKEAACSYQKAIELNPKPIAKYYHKFGQCLAKQKNFEEAIAAYQKAIELGPTSYLYYHSLGDARFDQEHWNEAVALYKKAVELKPNFAWSHYNLGRALAHEGKTEEAIAAYERALEIQPNFAQCHRSLRLLSQTRQDKSEQPIVTE